MASISESSIGTTFGYLYFALVFTSILWGVGCLQLYLYYDNYWKYDRNWLKIYILVSWILDTVHQCLVMHQTYSYFVKSITNRAILSSLSKSFTVNVAITAFLIGVAHFFFIRRVWYISNKNRVITGILATSATALFITTLVVSGRICRFTELAQLLFFGDMGVWLNIIVGFTDTLIAVVLIWLLWRTRSGIKRTDSIITRLIIYTVSSGSVTALWALTAVISAAVTPGSFLPIFADSVIPKLYFNCMLASLNVRSGLRATPVTSGVSVHLSNLAAASGSSSSSSVGSSHKVPNSKALERHVEIDVTYSSDGQSADQTVASSEANVMHH